jgi:undecaprenyl pyrophosphate phosphatase UppP
LGSMWVMIAMLLASIAASFCMQWLLRVTDKKSGGKARR